VKAGMVEEEGVRESKVVILPYLYDFSKYSKPNSVAVAEIQKAYPARLRLIMVSRLVKLKQHHVVFPVIQELISEGMDIKLLVLDEGPEEAHLKSWIVEHKMEEYIFMLGFRRDFIDYMAACDVLVQPSLTDASNSVAKEMALMEKVIIVTERVGDYSDYVVDGQNGFLIPKSNPQDKIKAIIREIYHGNGKYHKLGVKLREDVVGLFGSEKNQKAINSYFDLMD
jgi:L-malate glycosyltransferase